MLTSDKLRGSRASSTRKSSTKRLVAASQSNGPESGKEHDALMGLPYAAALRKFVRNEITWQRCRYSAAVLLFIAACILIIYAEIARGWTEALFLKVRRNAIQVNCEPQEKNDLQLVYVSCPVVYMHDFRQQVQGSFLHNIDPGIELSGLSIDLQTEIYQWIEVANCGGCEGQYTDAHGNCKSGATVIGSCRYTFQKAWVADPVPTSKWMCNKNGQEDCDWPQGGQASVANTGTIPESLRPFKKTAEHVSIGAFPGRYYLDVGLIDQLPARTAPLSFPQGGLPTVPGKITTISGSSTFHELRLQTDPASNQPDIGDLRARVTMTDFLPSDSKRYVSVIAKQGPYIHGGRHRTLIPWNSGLKSWKDGRDLFVNWLSPGDTSMDDIIYEERKDALKGTLAMVVSFRIWGLACIFSGLILLFSPVAKVWLRKRDQNHWRPVTRDIAMILSLALTCSIAAGTALAALPWLFYWPLCGGVLLTVAALLVAMCGFLAWKLDVWTDLRAAVLEWRGRLPESDTSSQVPFVRASVTGEEPSDTERGSLKAEAASLSSLQTSENYGATVKRPTNVAGEEEFQPEPDATASSVEAPTTYEP